MLIDVEQKLAPELSRDERILWTGMPRQGFCLRPQDAFLIPFSLMWGGFAIFWESSVLSSNAPFVFRLWGIPFVLVGLYIIAGRFFVDSYFRSRTWYGVTNERVIILTAWRNRDVKSITLQGLSDISVNERSDGRGTITFGPISSMSRGWLGPSWPGGRRWLAPAFDLIADVRNVYDLIREAQRSASHRAGSRQSAPTGLPGLDSRTK